MANLRFSSEIVQPKSLNSMLRSKMPLPNQKAWSVRFMLYFVISGKAEKAISGMTDQRRYLYQQDLRGVLAQFPVQLFRLLRRGERRGYFEDFDSVAASGQIALDARHCLGTVFEDVEKLDL